MSSSLATTQPAAVAGLHVHGDDYAFLDRDEAEEATAAKGQQPHADEMHGFVYGMPFEEYAAVDALNGSKIVNMRRSPMQYRHMCDNPSPETPAMALGTITHRSILEPDALGEIAVWGREEWMKVRNGGKWEAFQKENEGRTILTVKDYEAVLNMTTGVLNNEPIRKYAHAEGPTEVCMFWRHPVTGRRFKARLDKLIPSTNTIFDLKTTRDCHSFKFGSQAYALGYHIKAALYMQGYEILTGHRPDFRIGAIESKAPHESAVYRITPDVYQQGWDELEMLVSKITDCERTGEWRAEHDEETDLMLPAWTMYAEADTYETDV